jgi:hypothetical protein
MSTYQHSINDAIALAEKKAGIDGWKGYLWEAAKEDSIVKGCVPDGIYSKGPRKGRPRFSKPKTGTDFTVVVTRSELDVEALRYETETGKCWHCRGTTERVIGWSREHGARTKPCERCNASGNAPAESNPASR